MNSVFAFAFLIRCVVFPGFGPFVGSHTSIKKMPCFKHSLLICLSTFAQPPLILCYSVFYVSKKKTNYDFWNTYYDFWNTFLELNYDFWNTFFVVLRLLICISRNKYLYLQQTIKNQYHERAKTAKKQRGHGQQ